MIVVHYRFQRSIKIYFNCQITNELRNQGLVIYGLPKIPALDKQVTWAEAYDVTVLNGGLQVCVFYRCSLTLPQKTTQATLADMHKPVFPSVVLTNYLFAYIFKKENHL
jgi:hypothetical protein